MKILVTVPTLNEEKTIGKTLESIIKAKKLMPRHRISVLICDGYSTDETWKIAKSYSDNIDIEIVCTRTYGDSIKKAFEKVLFPRRSIDYVVILDSESHDIMEMLKALKYINNEKLIVAGTRTKYQATLLRKLITVFARAYVHFLFQIGIVDVTSGFRSYPMWFVDKVHGNDELFNAPNYVVNVNLAIEAQKQNCEIYNFPMSYFGGHSNLTIWKFFKSLVWGVKLWAKR